jgi:predicted O-methyltransferase YrrM
MLKFLNAEISDKELSFLRESFGSGKIIVEIGSYAGKATLALSRDNIVIAVDPFIPYKEPNVESLNLKDIRSVFKGRIKNKTIIWIEKKSEEAVKEINFPVDCVFIDGEHTKKALKKDINWFYKIKPGGLIAFHDYLLFPEVKSFVDQELYHKLVSQKKAEFFRKEENLIIFKKL